MAPVQTPAQPPASAHAQRCSITKRTPQDAFISTMGSPSTIPLLQMIITLLALSECLPISTGGSSNTPGETQQRHNYPPNSNVLPPSLSDQHSKTIIENMEKVWIQRFENSDYFKQLPKTLQADVREFLYTRTRNFLRGDQSLNSQGIPKGSMSPRDSVKSITDSSKLEDSDRKKKVKKTETAVTVTVPGKSNHRSKRSYGRIRDFDNRISPYLSDGPINITYTHVVPCVYADRYYCLNGGTCVFVGALDLKTCRCPMGYTGLRCEMIDQEYILSLLTNSIMFD